MEQSSSSCFNDKLMRKLHQATRLELVWDRYITDSLKGTATAKWRKGARRRVVHGWCNDPREVSQLPQSRREQDRSFLSGVLHESFQLADKELVITKGDYVLSKPPLLDTSVLAPCNHKEANSRIMVHAAHTAHNGHKKSSSTQLTQTLLSWQWL